MERPRDRHSESYIATTSVQNDELKEGNGMDNNNNDIGPVVTRAQLEEIEGHIAKAMAK
ncbi:hypothetical protein [Microbulbifer elongatus]|uniref:hypothetical protein n=1 Tax=Microbulbifer elongatus TaxID=86173 RepID=UPI001CFD3551|nr:hypothetical protein [Microbulbifer elongatus]